MWALKIPRLQIENLNSKSTDESLSVKEHINRESPLGDFMSVGSENSAFTWLKKLNHPNEEASGEIKSDIYLGNGLK